MNKMNVKHIYLDVYKLIELKQIEQSINLLYIAWQTSNKLMLRTEP